MVVLAVLFAGFVAGTPNPDTDCKDIPANYHPSIGSAAESPNYSSNRTYETNCDTPPWYAALKRPEWLSLIVATIGIGFIGWQSWETRIAAQATKDNLFIYMSKERARLVVDIKTLDYSKNTVDFVVTIHGPTAAFVQNTYSVTSVAPESWVNEPELGEAVTWPITALPAIIGPNDVPIECYSLLDISDGRDILLEEIRSGRLFVVIRGVIKYKDVFDKEHETTFRYMWRDRSGIVPDYGEWEKCGRADENRQT